ncbi:hypothetical protein ACA910_000552 [Epithemia clementina (nom. ined.)]
MFLEPERWNDAYAEILRECGGGGGRRPSRPVLVVVAATSVDAVCASRIWTYWMRADGIVYELLAADQWTLVQERLLSGTKGEESEYASFSYYYGACLLFNMGATVNLTRLLSVPCPPPRHHTGLDDVRMENVPRKLPCKIFVVDGRRPIHLANLYDRSHIVVLCDRLGCGGTGGADNENDDEDDDDDVPSDGDNLSGTESSTDEEDDDDDSDEDDESDDDDEDEGEHEFQEGDLQNPASKRHVHGRDEMKEDEDDDNALDKENEPSSVNKMRKPQSSTANNSSDPVNMTATTIDTALTSTTMDVDHDDDDDENNNHSTGNLWPSLSTHNHQEHDSSFAENNDENSNNDVPEASQPDDEVPPMPVLTPRELHRHRRERLRRYYARGTYRGSPSSFVSWHMTSQSRFAQSADLLWLAMTGVSGAFGYHELDRHAYMALAEHLQQACEVLFPTDPYLRHSNSHGHGTGNNGASSTVYAEYLMTNSNNHYDNAGTTTASTRTKIGVSENGRILCEPEFRFFLLRQSTLYQAMIQSDYIATTWQITTAAGRLKLHEWLATLGFPLHDCQQPFGLLKPALRRRLQPAVRETAPQYGLPDLEVPGFFRVTGFQSLLSAADAAHAIAALLALPAANPSSSSTSSSLEQEPARKQERNQPTQQAQPNPIVEHNTAVIQKSFQLAFDALNYQDADPYGNSGSDSSSNNNSMSTLVNGSLSSGHTTTGIAGGFRLASHLQHAIQMTAASLMDRRAITRLSHFRYAYITCSSNVSSSNSNNTNSQQTQAAQTTTQKFHVFAQPLVLTRLAYYLMDWHRASDQWTGSKARPLILCAQDPRTASYTVVGQVYPETEGSLVRNTLGQYFSLAAETLNTSSGANNNNQTTAATVQLDYSMDSHIVQVAETHVQRFIEQLYYLMDSV